MILSVAIFLAAVSILGFLAAGLASAGLRWMGLPTRLVWLAAMMWGPVLLALDALGVFGGASTGTALGLVPVVQLPPLMVGPDNVGAGLGVEVVVGALWLLSALCLLVLLVRTHRGLLQDRSGWESTQVMGRDVYISTDRGPAVAGVLSPWIVLPRWVLDLPETELRMVLLHEEQHLHVRDSLLLGSALALVMFSPWNPVTWWHLRSLRTAMEMDCDQRVLRQAPDRVTYGSSLLSVAARASGVSLGLAAFTERSLSLKRRIIAMTAKTSRWTAVGGGVLVVLGAVVGVQACGLDGPLAPVIESQTVVDAAPLTAEPTFTPFTVAPSILNRDEVIAAMGAEYPPLLRDAGIGGSVKVYFYIAEDGRVGDVRLDQSSGHAALDDAALKVARVYRFSPALNKDKKVPVWVSFSITFQVP